MGVADLEKVDPKFATAITSQLSADLDVTVTAPFVNDENYWKRVCTEGRKWTNCLISEHGMSWKQLFFERLVPELVESFGVYDGVTRRHEDEFARPPMDGTHPRWATLYPRVPPTRPDGLPTKERFCRYGVECKGASIAASTGGVWPALDRIKANVAPKMGDYAECYAWASLKGAGGAVAAPPAAAAGGGGGGGGAAGAPAVPNPLETDRDMLCDSNVRMRARARAGALCVC